MAVHHQFVGENLRWYSLGLNAAFIEQNDSVAQVEHQIEIVRGNDDSDRQRSQDREQLTPGTRIEIARWLVQYEHFRLTGEDPSEGYPLPFAVAEMSRIEISHEWQADGRQAPGNTPFRLYGVTTEQLRTKRHVFGDRRGKELIVGILKDETDVLTHGPQSFRDNRSAIDPYRAVLWITHRDRGQKTNQMHEQS